MDKKKRPGFVNIDKYATFKPDMVWDLETVPWPFDAASVTEIAACHVLEHVGQQTDIYLGIIKQMYRVLVAGGTIEIRAPHYRGDGYWGDPTHVRPISPAGMALFSKKRCRMYAERGWPNTPLADYLDIDLATVSVSFALQPYWEQQFRTGAMTKEQLEHAANTYWNVVDEITMVMRKV